MRSFSFFGFWRVSLCSLDYPGAHAVKQVGLELRDLPVCWGLRHAPPHLAYLSILVAQFLLRPIGETESYVEAYWRDRKLCNLNVLRVLWFSLSPEVYPCELS